MRSIDLHMKNIRELEKRSIDKLKAELGLEEESEVETYGVQGRSIDFQVVSDQPLSTSTDPMHQIFLLDPI